MNISSIGSSPQYFSSFRAASPATVEKNPPTTDRSKMVLLKDGSLVPKSLVKSTLQNLCVANMQVSSALYHIVQICKNPDYGCLSSSVQDSKNIFKKLGLMEKDGRISHIIKNIILNAVDDGVGAAASIVDPTLDSSAILILRNPEGIVTPTSSPTPVSVSTSASSSVSTAASSPVTITSTSSSTSIQSTSQAIDKEEFKESRVLLKDGTYVSEILFATTLKNLVAVQKLVAMAHYDLFHVCMDPNYRIIRTPCGDSMAILKEYQLMKEDGTVDLIVKRIILNATSGDGLLMEFVNPTLNSSIDVISASSPLSTATAASNSVVAPAVGSGVQ